MKFSMREFDQQFPNDAACLAYLFLEQHGKDYMCKGCRKVDSYYRVKNRRCFACSWCARQIYPTAGTIFHRSRTPLKLWFFAMFLMTHSRNGVSACELQRHLGVKYDTAFRIAHRIRKLMYQDTRTLEGTVEVDETYVGGVQRRSRVPKKKAIVFGIAERDRKKVYAKVVANSRESTLVPIIFSKVEQGSTVMSDEFKSYYSVSEAGFTHYTVNHSAYQYADGNTNTNTIESFWSLLKRGLDGTHHAVSPKYLQRYVDEWVFRWNYRENVFEVLLAKAVRPF